jgi:hypothetical protein
MTRIAVAVTALLVSFGASACQSSSPAATATRSDTPPRIELKRISADSASIDVLGLSPADLSALSASPLTPDDWTALFRITVGDANSADRPAVLGTYTISDGVLRFVPRFPFDPGQRYDVQLDPSRLPSSSTAAAWRRQIIRTAVGLQAPERRQTTRVVAVFPGAEAVPENLLRMYIAFSAPMSLGGASGHVQLLDEHGEVVEDPFLPLDVDLWNDNRTRYTLLFDPGRVKRGILPNEKMGRPLAAGHRYTLLVDDGWPDAAGQKLAVPFRRAFRTGPPADQALDPQAWRIDAPFAQTRDPLRVTFPAPLDHALLHRALTVLLNGERVTGDVQTDAGETRWLFSPGAPWRAGDYQLHASSILEDVAGNRIGRPFEVEELAAGRLRSEARSAALPFRVRFPAGSDIIGPLHGPGQAEKAER